MNRAAILPVASAEPDVSIPDIVDGEIETLVSGEFNGDYRVMEVT